MHQLRSSVASALSGAWAPLPAKEFVEPVHHQDLKAHPENILISLIIVTIVSVILTAITVIIAITDITFTIVIAIFVSSMLSLLPYACWMLALRLAWCFPAWGQSARKRIRYQTTGSTLPRQRKMTCVGKSSVFSSYNRLSYIMVYYDIL